MTLPEQYQLSDDYMRNNFIAFFLLEFVITTNNY